MAPSEENVDTNRSFCITNEFLEEILKGKHPESGCISIISKSVDKAVAKGENYLSIMYQIEVQYKLGMSDDIETSRFMVKTYPEGDFIQKMIEQIHVFDRELLMYHDILPTLLKFAEDRLGKSFVSPLAPRCYATSRSNTLVLDDLKDQGYRMADRKKRLDLQHCRLVIASMAKLHSISAVLHQNNPNIISKCDAVMWCEANRDTVCKFLPRPIKSIADFCKSWEGFEHLSSKLHRVVPELIDRFLEAAKFQEDGFHVLIHGDCWINNILFKYSASGEPSDLRFVDFQISQIASPAIELSYFLYSSPQNDVREQHMNDLLREYHTQLCENIKKLGGNSEILTFDDLLKEMRRTAFFGFVVSTMSLGIMLAQSDEVPEMENIKEEDMDNEEMNIFIKIHSSSVFRKEYQPLLLAFDRMGIFD